MRLIYQHKTITKIEEAIEITKYEIKGHEEHRGEGPSLEWEEGFISGLEHLLDLFRHEHPDHPASNKPIQPTSG